MSFNYDKILVWFLGLLTAVSGLGFLFAPEWGVLLSFVIGFIFGSSVLYLTLMASIAVE